MGDEGIDGGDSISLIQIEKNRAEEYFNSVFNTAEARAGGRPYFYVYEKLYNQFNAFLVDFSKVLELLCTAWREMNFM